MRIDQLISQKHCALRKLSGLFMVFCFSFNLTAIFAIQGTLPAHRKSASGRSSTAKSTPTPPIDFQAAASQNMLLKTDLDWVLAGKSQRGWELYQPLINQLLATNESADSANFAVALAAWQKSIGLPVTGIMDKETWMRMVTTWQSRLIKNPSIAASDQLVVAATNYLYDPGRSEELRKVERETYAAYQRMVAAALADPTLKLANKGDELAPGEKFFKIVSAYRPQDYQDKLNQQSPNNTAGLAKISHHLTGHALDLYVGGIPTSTKDENRALQMQTKAYQWLVKNAEKFGFYPYFYEPWHWEYNSATAVK